MLNYFDGLKLAGIIVITSCVFSKSQSQAKTTSVKLGIEVYIYFLIRTRRAKQN